MSIAEEYARYAGELDFGDLPPPVVDHAKRLILDIMASATEVGADGGGSITAAVVGYEKSPRHDGAIREAVAGTVARLEQSTVDDLLTPMRRGNA